MLIAPPVSEAYVKFHKEKEKVEFVMAHDSVCVCVCVSLVSVPKKCYSHKSTYVYTVMTNLIYVYTFNLN